MKDYTPKKIEEKWQKIWEESKLYNLPDFKDLDKSKPKMHVLDMFPYPSGEGLHTGHSKIFTASDVFARFKRMQGYNVLHATGWDAFGLPAEQYAIKNKINPKQTTKTNTDTYRRQMQMLGLSYDWSREINTTSPEFYKWTQWIFLKLWEKGLVKEVYEPINWCPSCKTGLANEDLEDGKCERCESVVEKKPLRQYSIEITKYADKLLEGLDDLPWKESIKDLQRNWIGKSEGAEIDFKIKIKNKTENKKLKYLVFDFDGVIGDTCEATIQVQIEGGERTREEAIKNNEDYFNSKPSHARSSSPESIKISEEWAINFGKKIADTDFNLFDEFVKEIENLQNVKYAVVSSGSNAYVSKAIARTNLKPTHTLCFEDHHSKEEKIEQIAKDWSVDVREIIYVTDTKSDVYELENLLGKENLIGCAWGFSGKEKLLEVLPQSQIMDKFDELENKIMQYSLNKEDENVKNKKFTIFTTRPDTLFGSTYCVLSPEHVLVKDFLDKNLIENKEEVEKYIENVKNKTEIERSAEGKEKTGVKLEGIVAINPANNEELPIYIADYVLASYGTGAIMAVPAHDERDFEFAKKYEIEVKEVVMKRFVYTDSDTPREGVETLYRKVIDVILENDKGEFLLIKESVGEKEDFHFIGGGVEESDTELDTVYKETKEESGYVDVKVEKEKLYSVSILGFRHTKQKNQDTTGYFYHAKLKSEKKVPSEIEEGKHEMLWVKKADIEKTITWQGHLEAWQQFLKNEEYVYKGKGVLVNSSQFDGMESEEAGRKIIESVGGKMVSKYKLRDWVFARQRYWGEPFPLVHVMEQSEEGSNVEIDKKIYAVDESDLPVILPEVENYEPTGTGESPLANIDSWVNVRGYITEKNTFKEIKKQDEENFIKENQDKINSKEIEIINAKRETNTMPQWAGSSWYWLRYMDARNENRFVGLEEEKYWGQVDVYLGGLEHATRHLIYARFWHKFLYDIGEISTPEPFARLEAVGLVLAEGGTKMSKRSGNVINPDDIAEKWGVDTLRLYLLFMGPYHDSVSWNSNNLIGPRRFIERVWSMQYMVNNEFIDKDIVITELHKTIKKVTGDNEKLAYNTGVSQLMILLNVIDKENVYEGGLKGVSFETYKILLKLLSVYCPFVTEEIWRNFGGQKSIHLENWPIYDESKIQSADVKIAFQVNGKLRDVIEVGVDESEEAVIETLRDNEMYKKWVGEVEVKKVIFVKNKIINFIV